MSKTNLNFEFDVRIPDALVTQMMEQEITAAMLITMIILYKWSNWGTGKVRRVCASSLHLASNKAFTERTFSEALRKLEWMRWITRRTTAGSTKWYPVVIHNYKMVDDAGKVHILNPTDIKVYDRFPEGRCDEASDKGSWESSDGGSDEGSDRHESLPESEHQSSNESSPLPKQEREVSKQASEASGATRPSRLDSEEQTQHLYWSERNQREFTIEEVGLAGDYLMELFPRSNLGETDSVLMADIALDFQARYPNPNPKETHEHYADSVAEAHTVKHMADYLAWNRKHKKPAMQHATVAEFHRAWFSDNPRCARVQWEDHDPIECSVCKRKAKAADQPCSARAAAAAVGGFEPEEAE